MTLYRNALPQLDARQPFLTDGGLETWLLFHESIDLPYFAAYPLAEDEAGRRAVDAYFQPFFEDAKRHGAGFVIETMSWRANSDWGALLGHDAAELDRLNRVGVQFALDIRSRADLDQPIVISGVIGPRGDGYVADNQMTALEAEAYHHAQVQTFASTDVDMVNAFTITYVEEAIGIVRAAKSAGVPVVIGFTLETDGKLPSGAELSEAITRVDEATDGGPEYYMINCAHPTHFAHVLGGDAPWISRIRAVRANSSTASHAELDEATELDEGDPVDLGKRYVDLASVLPNLAVVGGCCGTDHRHINAISDAMFAYSA